MHPCFSPHHLPPTVGQGPCIRGPSCSPVRAAAALPACYAAGPLSVGTPPANQNHAHPSPPHAAMCYPSPPPFPFPATARPPPIKRAEHCWRPAPPLRSLVHARAHPLPPSPVTPTTALRHRSHPLFDEITLECYRPPLSGEHPLRALVSQISATLTFSVLSRSC
jgi:hypothetical protein